ncbi:VgrG-related protein [Streptomyces sp. NPDC021212]|uniref:VgrG-related protein n=1 Tax=Streptomyces sp. NPDC021212 TaxID=3365118 RepID=UPI0037B5D7CC
MSQKTYTSVLHVEVEGAKLPDGLARLLVDGWVDASVNVPSAFQLTFSNVGSDVLKTFPQLSMGAKVALFPVTDGRKGKAMLTGEITAMEVDKDGAGRSLVVRGFDPGHRLLRNRRVEGYPNMTAGDIARRLATRNKLTPGRIDSTRSVYELATQPNITDWDFLSRLAQENDVHLYFDNTGKMCFTDLVSASGAPSDSTPSSRSPYVLEFGTNELHSRVGVTSAGQARTVRVRGWDVKTKRPLRGQASAGTTQEARTDLTPAKATARFGKAELVGTDVPYGTQSQVGHAARALAEDVASSFTELEVAVTGNPDLRPGVPVALNGAGFPFEGKYTATGVRHVFASGSPYTTWVSVTGRQFRSLYGLASGGGGAEDAQSLPGVVNAIVTNITDPLRMGRVKLRFPWLSDTYESDWCRVAQFGGVRGGGLLLPEVEDEVLVAFDRGSLEHPYVLAGLYNGKDKPTDDPDGVQPVDRTRGRVNYRSLASRNGHIVELLDRQTPPKQGIRLQTGNGKVTVHLDQTRTSVTINSRGEVSIEGTRSVQVKSGGNLSLRAGGAVNIRSGGAVNIQGGGGVNVRAGGQIGIQAGAALNMSAGAAATLQAVGTLQLSATVSAQLRAVSVMLQGAVTANGIPVPPIP